MTQSVGRQAQLLQPRAGMLPVGADELRIAPRLSLTLRAAKLVSPCGEILCILRDISATGIKLRLFHPFPANERYALELGNGDRHFLAKVWERDGHAGFQFSEGPIDVAGMLDATPRFPRRQIRLRLDLPAQLSFKGSNQIALLRDISQQGALIESSPPLALGQELRLETAGLPELVAKIRWRRKAAHGLVFEQAFRLDELARIAAAIQANRPEPAASCDTPIGR